MFIPYVLTEGYDYIMVIKTIPREVRSLIVIKDVCKSYGEKKVLNNVSFHISIGERVGIIGLNGAGKTTLLNILSGILQPDSGFKRVSNTENILEKDDVKRDIVYVSGTKSSLWEDLRVRASYENCISMYHIDKDIAKKRLEELTEVFEIDHLLNSIPRDISLGERMRCELVYEFLISPKLLLLDETMIGIDVSIKHKIMKWLENYKIKDTTLIYTSHNLQEVEKICDRIILLDKGNIIFDGSVDELLEKYEPLYTLSVNTKGVYLDMEDLPIEKINIENGIMEIFYHKQKIETKQIVSHILSKCEIYDMRQIEPNLTDTIRKIYREEQ